MAKHKALTLGKVGDPQFRGPSVCSVLVKTEIVFVHSEIFWRYSVNMEEEGI